jgi:hypothetical protein
MTLGTRILVADDEPDLPAPARKIAAIPFSTRPRKPNFKRIELYATSFLLSHPVCFAYPLKNFG